ncbi:5808b097-2444-4600-b106-16884616c2bd [Thermothielavioides terrestris]|uniref:5808b097-2444-4600-b106-16884616c2bd n=1 Tax=Thermothielavioides terrestris TaxID=2587410 RepID=A0A3S4AU69_9PEZI|nr:5808b097-2444-4600-b106-16884616c2bd [Thermothielavioides terrestris]
MKLLLVSLVALVVGTRRVLAGSHVWQPPVSNERSNALARRYFVINDDPSEGDRMPWRNRQIRYCFDKPDDKKALEGLLLAAHDLWLSQGLGSEFTLAEVGDDECKGEKRFDTLLVQWTGDSGRMATFEALPQVDSVIRQSKNPDVRPKMLLTTSTSMGMLDQVKNVAHELGHAWGLYHEHQNPAFWSRGTIHNALGGSVFGPENGGNWRCENLKDYARHMAGGGLIVQKPGSRGYGDRIGMDMLCKDYEFASKAQFSARDYLPMPRVMGVATSAGTSAKDVDWDSIMIYPSGAGAIGDASPGNDQRQPILLKPDGSRIPINGAPSQRDIAAMHKLYGRSKSARGKELLQKAGGTVTSNFKKLYSKSSGRGDDGSSCL